MPHSVEIIWWVAIALALVATLVAAGRLMAVVKVCGEILQLARRTVPAAQGIAQNTAAIAGLGAVIELAPTLLSVAGQIDGSAKLIADTLDSVAPKESR